MVDRAETNSTSDPSPSGLPPGESEAETNSTPEPGSPPPRGSRWLSRILPGAVRLWLQSQAEYIDNLSFTLEGRDRDLLRGYLPQVSLQADKAIYQGIHLSHLTVTATEIRINLGQIVRGKALQLQAPFPVQGQLRLTEADLNASLTSELLGTGLYDFLTQLAAAQPALDQLQVVLAACPDKTVQPHYLPHVTLGDGELTLALSPRSGQGIPPITLAMGMGITAGRYLTLDHPRWIPAPGTSSSTDALPELHGFSLDLGPETTLTDCTLTPGQLLLAGSLRVLP